MDIYIGQTASTLTSRLQRTGNSRRAAALAFALFTRSVRKRNRVKGTLFAERTGARCAAVLAFALVTGSVRKRNRVKGTLLCTLRRAHRRSTGAMRHNLGYFGLGQLGARCVAEVS